MPTWRQGGQIFAHENGKRKMEVEVKNTKRNTSEKMEEARKMEDATAKE